MKKLGMARGTWIAALLGCVMALQALPAMAQQVNWKMHIVWVPARDEAKAYQRFADLVNERAKGKLNIAVHPGGSLGVKDVELSWILEDNAGMRSIIESIGGHAYKRYRIYERQLTEGEG